MAGVVVSDILRLGQRFVFGLGFDFPGRRLLLALTGRANAEIAELLGNSMKVVEKYYSKWDTRRQARLEKRLEDFWQNDPLTKNLAS